ncbi:MAG TPA: hypothetical protein VH440_09140 [Candidatus Limnocylindrales bacterium]
MNLMAAAATVAGFAIAAWLGLPAVRRTSLGIWHPAAAWLALEAVFFGVGSAILALSDGRDGPAWNVTGALVAFGLAVRLSDAFARRRVGLPAADPADATGGPPPEPTPAGIRWPVVVVLVGLGLLALLPTLLEVGLPALALDVTGARTAIGGLDVQVLRVALPAGLVAAVVLATVTPSSRIRIGVAVAVLAAIGAELALASRYLAAELIAAIVIGLALAARPLAGRILLGVAAAAVAVFVVVGVLRAYGEAGGNPLAFAAERSVNRIVLIQPRTLDAIQAAIPAEVPYFGGLTWFRRLAPLFGRDDVPNLGYWIYPRLFPDQVTPGYAAPGLLGEAWANFGPAGVALVALLGVVAERLGALIARRRRALVDIAAASLAILFLARTHALGVNGLLVLAILVAVWRILAGPMPGLRADLARTLTWRA